MLEIFLIDYVVVVAQEHTKVFRACGGGSGVVMTLMLDTTISQIPQDLRPNRVKSIQNFKSIRYRNVLTDL